MSKRKIMHGKLPDYSTLEVKLNKGLSFHFTSCNLKNKTLIMIKDILIALEFKLFVCLFFFILGLMSQLMKQEGHEIREEKEKESKYFELSLSLSLQQHNYHQHSSSEISEAISSSSSKFDNSSNNNYNFRDCSSWSSRRQQQQIGVNLDLSMALCGGQ